MALFALLVGAVALPMSGFAYDAPPEPLERTAEFKLAGYVLEGQVQALRRLDKAGSPASAGPRFRLDLKVSAVLKTKEKGKPAAGDTVSVLGWVEGSQKQSYLPKEKDEVLAFLKRQKGGSYEPLSPTGFKARGGTSLAGPAAPGRGPKKEKE
jgi:hypothetical protein